MAIAHHFLPASIKILGKVSGRVFGGLVIGWWLLGCSPSSVRSPAESVELGNPTQTLPADSVKIELPVLDESEATSVPVKQPVANSSEPPSAQEIAVTERLVIASVNDPQAVKVFLAQMRAAAIACEPGCTTEQDRKAIASLVRYPFTTYENGEIVETYDDSEDLIADFETVVTQPVLDALRTVQYENLFANYQGVMIGNGEVWFGPFDEGLKIKTINAN